MTLKEKILLFFLVLVRVYSRFVFLVSPRVLMKNKSNPTAIAG